MLEQKYKNLKAKYYQNTDINYRKERGQVFTPLYIANLMVSWVMNGKKDKENFNILDPAVGIGAFFQSILSTKNIEKGNNKDNIKMCGVEKDKLLSDKCKKLYHDHKNITIKNTDYLLEWHNKSGDNGMYKAIYDGIICNPPYLIYKKYNTDIYLPLFEEKIGIKLSGFTNLYILFLLKSLTELKQKGRMAYIVPSEFMNTDYGQDIKMVLKEYGYLRYVLVLNYNLFPVNTTSSILLFSNDECNSQNTVQFININSKEDFLKMFLKSKNTNHNNNSEKIRENILENRRLKGDIDEILSGFKDLTICNKNLIPEKKWRFYYQKINSDDYQNLVKLSSYARVTRGIATGANDFFLFNKSKKHKYNIHDKYLLPCISKSSYVKKQIINKAYFKHLRDEDEKVFLLDAANKEHDSSISKYIKYGENRGYAKRYLTRNRNPWYKLENKSPAPILAKVFNRKGLKFIVNEVDLYNLTAFHGIYLISNKYEKILKAYLLTDVAVKIIEDNRREYGDGLNKFEPNDLNNSFILDLKIINNDDQEKIYHLYDSYRRDIFAVDLEIVNQDKKNIKKGFDILNKMKDIFLKYML